MSAYTSFMRGVLAFGAAAPVATTRRKRPSKAMKGYGPSLDLSWVRIVKAGREGPQGEVCQYRSVAELKSQWRFFDRRKETGSLTVILVLDPAIRGSLRELIRRTQWSERLILVTEANFWPGTDSLGDLALSTPRLGWGSIRACRDVAEAIAECGTDRVLIFVPHEAQNVLAAGVGDLAGRVM